MLRKGRVAALVFTGVVAMLVGTFGFAAGVQAAPGMEATPAWGSNQRIINYYSNKCLQPQSYAANARIEQRTCSTSSLQRWQAIELGDGYVMLQNQGSGMCMDLLANSEAEVMWGTPVQQFYCWSGYPSEHWNRSSGSRTDHFQVWTRIKGLCLDVTNRSAANGALLQVWGCSYYEVAQEFRFVDVG